MNKNLVLKIAGALALIHSVASFISIPFIFSGTFLHNSFLKVLISTLIDSGRVLLDNGLSFILFGNYLITTPVALLGAGIYLITGVYYYWIGWKKRTGTKTMYWSAIVYLINMGLILITAFAGAFWGGQSLTMGLIILPFLQGTHLFLFLLGIIGWELW